MYNLIRNVELHVLKILEMESMKREVFLQYSSNADQKKA